MIIDFHTHVLPPRIKTDRSRYVDKDAAFASIYSSDKANIATAEDLIESMDREGIDISVMVNYAWSTPELCIETNDYILESVSRYPERLAGFCMARLDSGDSALNELERCVKAGARGVGEIRPDTLESDFTAPAFTGPLAHLLRQHNLILLTHASEPVGHSYPGKGEATPGMIYPFINANPDLKVVCAHWGGGLPFYSLMPEVRTATENVYYDTAASPFLYRPEIYTLVSELVGADRILFGSDYPLMPPGRLLREIYNCGLPDESREEILSGNARRLLGI